MPERRRGRSLLPAYMLLDDTSLDFVLPAYWMGKNHGFSI